MSIAASRGLSQERGGRIPDELHNRAQMAL
jgi:hypothetical protein